MINNVVYFCSDKTSSEEMIKCLEPLSVEQHLKTLDSVGYNLETLRSDVENLRKWTIDQKHYPETKLNEPDSFYEVKLMGSKGNLEISKQKIEAYYFSRNKYPLLFNTKASLDEVMLKSAETILIATLPKSTPEGSRVTMMSVTDVDPKKYDLAIAVRRLLLVVEMRSREEGVFNGEWVVFDANNITVGLLIKFLSPRLIKSALDYIQKVLNARIKGIIIFNAPKFVERTINSIIRPLLKEKIAKRVFVYSEEGVTIGKHLPKNILPKEYGGEEESLKKLSDIWLHKGRIEKQWLQKILTDKVDESKVEKPKGSYFSSRFKFFSAD